MYIPPKDYYDYDVEGHNIDNSQSSTEVILDYHIDKSKIDVYLDPEFMLLPGSTTMNPFLATTADDDLRGTTSFGKPIIGQPNCSIAYTTVHPALWTATDVVVLQGECNSASIAAEVRKAETTPVPTNPRYKQLGIRINKSSIADKLANIKEIRAIFKPLPIKKTAIKEILHEILADLLSY